MQINRNNTKSATLSNDIKMAKKKTKNQSAGLSPERFLKEKANKLPIYKCYISKNYKNEGKAIVTIARERGNGKLCVANFLIDAYCLGVKDVFGNVNLEKEYFKDQIKENSDHLIECDYPLAHNYVLGAVEFAGEADLQPAAPYRIWQYILSEDNDDIPFIDIEFGKDGKYLLVTEAGTKEALLIPKLKEKLGENFDFILDDKFSVEDYAENDNDYLQEERRFFHYDYPQYPSDPKLNHPFIKDVLLAEGNSENLPKEDVEKILSLPKEEAEEDILNLILWEIGRTYPLINEDPKYTPENLLILHALLLLALMESKNGFKAGMEILRQSTDFVDVNLFIEASEYLCPAMVSAPVGKEQLDELRKYFDEKGHTPSNIVLASEVLAQIAVKYPELKDEVLSIIKDTLTKMPERLESGDWYNVEVPAFFTSAVLDLKASELLPEIKRVYATGLVDPGVCGDIDEVTEELRMPHSDWQRITFPSKETLMKYLTE